MQLGELLLCNQANIVVDQSLNNQLVVFVNSEVEFYTDYVAAFEKREYYFEEHFVQSRFKNLKTFVFDNFKDVLLEQIDDAVKDEDLTRRQLIYKAKQKISAKLFFLQENVDNFGV